jgi:aspartate kinase
LHVRSTFADEDGTWVISEDDRMLEKAIISGVAATSDEAVYRIAAVDRAELFERLAQASVNVDTIIQVDSEIVFSAPLADAEETEGALDSLGARWNRRDDLAKVSVVGAGMRTHPGVAARTFEVLRNVGADACFVVTSPIKISFYVLDADAARTVAALHDAFALSSI